MNPPDAEVRLTYYSDSGYDEPPDAAVVLYVPAAYQPTQHLDAVESALVEIVQRCAPFDEHVRTVHIKFKPSVQDWRSRAQAQTVKVSVGDVLGDRYRIVRHIGGGGFAEVFEAVDGSTNESCAVKVIKAADSAVLHEQTFERMAREIRYLQHIDHPNVIAISGYGQRENGQLWYAMPLADGTLKDRLPTLTRDEASLLSILDEIAAGLDRLAADSIVHRDVSPSNILYIDGRWVLADLGLSINIERDSEVLTQTTWGLGTQVYKPNEAAKTATAAWDVHSLGQVCLDLMTGITPPARPPRQVPDHVFAPAVRRAIAEHPHERFATAGAFVSECKRLFNIKSNDDWEGPTKRIARITDELADDTTRLAAFDELITLLEGNDDLIDGLVDVFSAWTTEDIESLEEQRPAAFRAFVNQVVSQIPRSHTPFVHLNRVADFLERCVDLHDDHYAQVALRWIAETGVYWNQFYVMDASVALAAKLAKERPHILRPALDGLEASVINHALPDMSDTPPDARPSPRDTEN